MSIEYDEKDIKEIEDKVGEIQALATKARMGSLNEAWHCLKEIITKANGVMNLLENGCFANEADEVELSR